MGFPDLIRLRYNAFQFFETVLVSMDVVCKEMAVAVGVHDLVGMSCSIVGVGKSVNMGMLVITEQGVVDDKAEQER